MRFIIYGAGIRGKRIFELWNKTGNIEFLAYYDQKVTGQCNGLPVIHWRDGDRSVPVLISLQKSAKVVQIYNDLHSAGFTKLYWYRNDPYAESFTEQIVDTSTWGEAVLPQVEMHAADCCNLNCRGCTHFSPLFHAIDADLSSRLDDVKILASKVSHILYFFILGGEPFMNPEIEDYIKGIRVLLPDTCLILVTNGLLIPRLEPSVLDCIRENRVMVSISEYEPTHRNIKTITKSLKKAGVQYQIRSYDSRQVFNKPIEMNPSGDYSFKCISNGCVNIYKGKISRCPTLMYAFKFNETFDKNLPTDGIMDLSNCVSGRELIKKLRKSVPLCRHCVENSISWGRCQGSPKVSDFAVI